MLPSLNRVREVLVMRECVVVAVVPSLRRVRVVFVTGEWVVVPVCAGAVAAIRPATVNRSTIRIGCSPLLSRPM